MWTANTARSASSFCYYYSDVDSQDSTPEQVTAAINDDYGQDCLGSPSTFRTPPSVSVVNGTRPKISARTAQKPKNRNLAYLAQSVPNILTADGAVRDYVANIEVDSMSLGGPVTVYLFDGPANDDVRTWSTCPTLIGKRIFLTARPGSSAYSGSYSVTKVGSISMTDALIDRVQSGRRLGGLGIKEVTWYLNRNLHWKVVKSDGCIVPNEEVPGLRVSVVTADVRPAASRHELPVWGNARLLNDATAGKCGGLSASE